jgi:hypothetical protein
VSGQLVPDIIAEFIEQVVEIIVKGSLQHRLPAATVEVAGFEDIVVEHHFLFQRLR